MESEPALAAALSARCVFEGLTPAAGPDLVAATSFAVDVAVPAATGRIINDTAAPLFLFSPS